MAKKIRIGSLVVEITRKCNMCCQHCLRGEAEPVDIKYDVLQKLFSGNIQFDSITFSGGEPMLNPDAIRFISDEILKSGQFLDSFYIVTNGKKYDSLVIDALLDLYSIADEKELCGLALSIDEFHEPISKRNIQKLRGLSFFTEDKMSKGIQSYLLNEGRAKENGIGVYDSIVHDANFEIIEKDDIDIYIENNFEIIKENDNDIYIGEPQLYLNIYGDMITSCDLSYENQKKHSLGNILDGSFQENVLKLINS